MALALFVSSLVHFFDVTSQGASDEPDQVQQEKLGFFLGASRLGRVWC